MKIWKLSDISYEVEVVLRKRIEYSIHAVVKELDSLFMSTSVKWNFLRLKISERPSCVCLDQMQTEFCRLFVVSAIFWELCYYYPRTCLGNLKKIVAYISYRHQKNSGWNAWPLRWRWNATELYKATLIFWARVLVKKWLDEWNKCIYLKCRPDHFSLSSITRTLNIHIYFNRVILVRFKNHWLHVLNNKTFSWSSVRSWPWLSLTRDRV